MELNINLPYHYKEYDWQIPIVRAFFDNKEIWMNIHRRGGKDLLSFCRFLLPSAFKRPGTYQYIWPTLKQGRDAIWEGKDEDGRDFMKYYVPQEMIAHQDNQDMKLTVYAIGGTSQIQIFGTNKLQYKDLRGKPSNGSLYSEYSRQDPRGRDVVTPMIRKTDGWEVINSTPNGNNHFKSGYYTAKSNPGYAYHITATVEDTFDHKGKRLVTEEAIQRERDNNRTEDYINQEYFCSFNQGIEGTYLGRQLQSAANEGRILGLAYDETVPVNTAWDLGVGDFMSIIFYQMIGNWVHILDYLEATGYSFVYYAQKLKERNEEKGYFYGTHYAPFDIKNREMGSLDHKEVRALSRHEKAEKIGIVFDEVEKTSFDNSVDNARAILRRCKFNSDSKGVQLLISHLEQWGKKWNDINQEYGDFEDTNIHKHAGAAFRYMSTVVMEETHLADYDEIDDDYKDRCEEYIGL
jgi:hypothetical protein